VKVGSSRLARFCYCKNGDENEVTKALAAIAF